MIHKYPLVELVSKFEKLKKNHEAIVTHGAMNPLIRKSMDENILKNYNHRRVDDLYKEIGAQSDEDVYFAIIKARTQTDEIKVRDEFLRISKSEMKRIEYITATHTELVNAGFEMKSHESDTLKYCDIYYFNLINNGQKQ